MRTVIHVSNLHREVNKLANQVLTLLNSAEQSYQIAEDIIVRAGDVLHFLLAERELEDQQLNQITISNIKPLKSWMKNSRANVDVIPRLVGQNTISGNTIYRI